MKQRLHFMTPVSVLIVATFVAVSAAHAQFSADFQTNTIDGVVSNWVGNYLVGSNTFLNALQIADGATLKNSTGYVGFTVGASNNVAIVNGTGSVWTNSFDLRVGHSGAGNQLVITNGGAVFNGSGWVGANSSSSNNTVLVSGSGSVWDNKGDLFLGSPAESQQLVISCGGAVYNTYGRVGGSNSFVLVSDSGSVWSNRADLDLRRGTLVITNSGVVHSFQGILSGNALVSVSGSGSVWNCRDYFRPGVEAGGSNQLIIIDGGAVYCPAAQVSSGHPPGGDNTILVSGSRSVLSNGGDLVFGLSGRGNRLIITNGGAVCNNSGFVGYSGAFEPSGTNTALVTGSGSVWYNRADLYVGYSGKTNELTITSGGSVIASNVFIGHSGAGTPSNNILQVDGGFLFATNAVGNGALVVSRAGGRGTLILDSGTITVDNLILTNGSYSVVEFNGGVIHSKGTAVTNAQPFVVGNGISAATFHVVGGVHSFNDGLRIRNNATLSGCGTINGAVVVDSGGTVLADGGGTLTFTGGVTNNGAMAADNGSMLESYGTLVNNGAILLFNGGTTNFLGTFINNGTVLNAGIVRVSSCSRSGNDVIVQIPSATGFSYQLQITPSLEPPAWTDSVAAQAGTGGVLAFTDPDGATNQPSRLYRIKVTAQ